MFEVFGELNYFAILIAIVANMIVGSLWYSGLLFGNVWMQLKGYKKEDLQGAGPAMAFAVVFGAVQAIILAFFLFVFGTTFWYGIATTLFIWFGFVLTNEGLEMLFGGKKFQLFILDSMHRLVTYLAMAVVLLIWQ